MVYSVRAYWDRVGQLLDFVFFFSSRRRHTRYISVTGVQTCALPILYAPQSEGWREVVSAFGEEVLTAGGEIDRRKLGPIVFGDPEALRQLNAITHPKIYRLADESIRKLAEEGREVAVLEAALLIEAGWTPLEIGRAHV